MFLPDVDQFGVLIVPHTDGDVDCLFSSILPGDLDYVALAGLLNTFSDKAKVGILTLIADVEILDIEVDLDLRTTLVVPSLNIVVEASPLWGST